MLAKAQDIPVLLYVIVELFFDHGLISHYIISHICLYLEQMVINDCTDCQCHVVTGAAGRVSVT